MGVNTSDLARRVGVKTIDVDREAELNSAINVANILVLRWIEGAWREVPEPISDECVLRVAVGVYKGAHGNEESNILSADGTVLPNVANDPMRKAYDLLRPYCNRV